MALRTLGNPDTKARVEREIFRQGRDVSGTGFRTLTLAALVLTTVILGILIIQVVVDGWPVLTERLGDFFTGRLRSRSIDEKLGIAQGLAGSFWIAVVVTLLSFPVGIASAVYLEHYAPDNLLTRTIDIAIRNLAGVPSVVYGLLGLFLFVKTNDSQSTLLAAGLTLAILVLPIVVITAAEAIRAVPSSLSEGAYGVGATKWDVIRSQILPFAAPGILTGTLLSLSRAIGEAAPLILVGAITDRLPARGPFINVDQLGEKFTAMPIVIVGWVEESGRDAGFGAAAGAAIVILLGFVIAMNSGAVLLRNRFEKKRG